MYAAPVHATLVHAALVPSERMHATLEYAALVHALLVHGAADMLCSWPSTQLSLFHTFLSFWSSVVCNVISLSAKSTTESTAVVHAAVDIL